MFDRGADGVLQRKGHDAAEGIQTEANRNADSDEYQDGDAGDGSRNEVVHPQTSPADG